MKKNRLKKNTTNPGWRKKAIAAALALALVPCGLINNTRMFTQAKADSDYRQWKQYDPQWNEHPAWPRSAFPTNTDSYAYMRQAGCLVTSISMLLRHYNIIETDNINEFSPWICNEKLKAVGAFSTGARLNFSKVSEAFPGFEYAGYESYNPQRASELYKQGHALVGFVETHTVTGHYVAISDASDPDNIEIYDPDSDYTRLDQWSKVYGIVIFKPTNGVKADNAPKGLVEGIQGSEKGLALHGWCFDSDQPDQPVTITVQAGNVKKTYTANTSRPDIAAKYKTGENHGFDLNVPFTTTGRQSVKITASNTGWQGQKFDTVLYEGEIAIGKDEAAPVITDAKRSATDFGTRFTAQINDDFGLDQVRAVFWKEGDVQPADPFASGKEMKLENGVYTCEFSFRDPQFDRARWKTAIYARDVNGNAAKVDTGVADFSSLPEQMVMYRLYNYDSGEHFYTASQEERQDLIALGWKDEETAWISPLHSDTPVYRLYNLNSGDHHYTTNKEERDTLISLGWKDEEVGWYSAESTGVPVYRQFNPNAKTGSHNFTILAEENDILLESGWSEEGIGWYGLESK